LRELSLFLKLIAPFLNDVGLTYELTNNHSPAAKPSEFSHEQWRVCLLTPHRDCFSARPTFKGQQSFDCKLV
jgi:hypothetical protein